MDVLTLELYDEASLELLWELLLEASADHSLVHVQNQKFLLGFLSKLNGL